MAALDIRSIASTIASVTIAWVTWRVYSHRRWINQLRKRGIPMPPWSWITGHIIHLYKYSRSLPPGGLVQLAFYDMARDFEDEEMFLVDIWPLSEPMFLIFNPEAAFQITQKFNLPKGYKTLEMTKPITGGPTVLSMDGEDWKKWRALFNPGFSAAVLTAQIPQIVEFVEAFCERLNDNVGKGIVHLEHLTARLTFEVILKISLDADLGKQYHEHVFVKAVNTILEWHSFWDVTILMNPARPFVNWYNGRVADTWIQSHLQERWEILKHGHQASDINSKNQARSVMDMTLEAYMQSKPDGASGNLDPDFLTIAAHQMRLFLLAGNDTTSSTIVFTYHLLSKHPEIIAELRAEHDAVFGTDPSTAASQLKANPNLLNKCSLTLAVVKETLRLYPPASSMRLGTPSATLQTRHGVPFSTNGLSFLMQHQSMHRNPRLWPHPNTFLPSRWLVDPDHELHPKSGAWRPFELGPRNCIGQTLAMNEIRIVLILTVRTLAIRPAYEEFDREKGRIGEGYRYRGERAYQTEKAGGHPSDGYPCFVERR